jgi:hypothetical protein
MMERRRRNPPVVGPVLFIGAGVLLLLQNAGMLPYNFWQVALTLWPLIFILIGVEIVLRLLPLPWPVTMFLATAVVVATVAGVTYVATQGTEWTSSGSTVHIEQDAQGAQSAQAGVDFVAGDLRVGGHSGSELMVGDVTQANGQPTARVAYDVAGTAGDLHIDMAPNATLPATSFGLSRRWDIRLTSTMPLRLAIKSSLTSDLYELTNLQLSELRVDGGLAARTIYLPATGVYVATIRSGLASNTIYVPEGVAAHIQITGGLSASDVDEQRFPKHGDSYESPDYSTATNRADIYVDGGLSSVVIK